MLLKNYYVNQINVSNVSPKYKKISAPSQYARLMAIYPEFFRIDGYF
ncbi:hypothetical protein ACVWXS_005339, partial [Lysinibacillus sp. TE18511]